MIVFIVAVFGNAFWRAELFLRPQSYKSKGIVRHTVQCHIQIHLTAVSGKGHPTHRFLSLSSHQPSCFLKPRVN